MAIKTRRETNAGNTERLRMPLPLPRDKDPLVQVKKYLRLFFIVFSFEHKIIKRALSNHVQARAAIWRFWISALSVTSDHAVTVVPAKQGCAWVPPFITAMHYALFDCHPSKWSIFPPIRQSPQS